MLTFNFSTDENLCNSDAEPYSSGLKSIDEMNLEIEDEFTLAGQDSLKVKRAAATGPIEDEDFVDPAQSTVVNNPLVMDQLRSYLDAQISGATGSSTPYQTNTRGIPAFILLEKSLEVMKVTFVYTCNTCMLHPLYQCFNFLQKTCTVVQPSYLTLAFNAFTNIQTQSFHVKEPYISQPAYRRIMEALNQCIMASQQHNFVSDNTTTGNATASNDTSCEGVVVSPTQNFH